MAASVCEHSVGVCERERHSSCVWIGMQARLGRLLCGWAASSPPSTYTGPASCWPSWCSLTNPWRLCGWSGRSSPPVSSAFWMSDCKGEASEKKKISNCQGIWLECLPTQHKMFFLVLPAPHFSLSYMLSWLFLFQSLLTLKRFQ